MRASKENAKRTLDMVGRLRAQLTDQQRDDLRLALLGIEEFIGAAERKLPTEAAYDKEAKRKKEYKKAVKK